MSPWSWPMSLFLSPPPPDSASILAGLTLTVDSTLAALTTATHDLAAAKAHALATSDLTRPLLQAAQYHQVRIDALTQQFAVAVRTRDVFAAQMLAKENLEGLERAGEALWVGNKGLGKGTVEKVIGAWEGEELVAEGGVEGVRSGIERVLQEEGLDTVEDWDREVLKMDVQTKLTEEALAKLRAA
ncbi:hypothetical protein P153DRAFT_391356 [Dothidotthia symphoricarpi CBS 119687]|uniref:Uncharacterized protein n=1 Tax=Dothidotthia symphoricarpi CBS 119687 TaxID=1392245 RepID=A0A6A5ZVS2_9PLEO|nr:uncharacterized protein P153DRAFT_391356 [Dothidotthia symphoricarpi CBS 119687]KAF2123629.1 hypothetical protein P153DRAFT_391356 [Dothidotthia symphoricarpi CBS 119687]